MDLLLILSGPFIFILGTYQFLDEYYLILAPLNIIHGPIKISSTYPNKCHLLYDLSPPPSQSNQVYFVVVSVCGGGGAINVG